MKDDERNRHESCCTQSNLGIRLGTSWSHYPKPLPALSLGLFRCRCQSLFLGTLLSICLGLAVLGSEYLMTDDQIKFGSFLGLKGVILQTGNIKTSPAYTCMVSRCACTTLEPPPGPAPWLCWRHTGRPAPGPWDPAIATPASHPSIFRSPKLQKLWMFIYICFSLFIFINFYFLVV